MVSYFQIKDLTYVKIKYWMFSYKTLHTAKLYPGSILLKGLEFVLSILWRSRTEWGKFFKYRHLLEGITSEYEEGHSGELWKQLPALHQEGSSQKALSSAFNGSVPAWAGLERTSWNSPVLQILHEACKHLLSVKQRIPCIRTEQPRKLWSRKLHGARGIVNRSSEGERTFLTKSQLQTFIWLQACHSCSGGSYGKVTALPSPRSFLWTIYSFQETQRKESTWALGLLLPSKQ